MKIIILRQLRIRGSNKIYIIIYFSKGFTMLASHNYITLVKKLDIEAINHKSHSFGHLPYTVFRFTKLQEDGCIKELSEDK
jgi:hypothetical protein